MIKTQHYPSNYNRHYIVTADISYNIGIPNYIEIITVTDYNTEKEIELIDIEDNILKRMEDRFYE